MTQNTTIGCRNVHHNAVDCPTANLPLEDWCDPCMSQVNRPGEGRIVGLSKTQRPKNPAWKNWPMPNDLILAGFERYTVVASVVFAMKDDLGFAGNDTFTVLLMSLESPFFRCAQLERHESPHGLTFKVVFSHPHKNIVPAVREYEQSGGDY